MGLKIAIIILFIALVISLFSSLTFLLKDKGATKRTWHALSVRLTIAAVLMGLIIYGMYTGQLGSNAPWDAYRMEQKKG